ncbi:MAG: NUDIX domain-containing protein [Paludibacteraceae bacterium]|nr:NUDIX domain-containing protein [Paludibacteraceae bacterium]
MKEELFPIVDESGRVIGKASRRECHGGSMLLHPVVHIHVFSSRGALFLQKRSETKDIQPGKWDTSVGGHVDYGEQIAEAAERECREELGIDGVKPELLYSYVWKSERERELVYVHRLIYDGPFNLDPTELDDGRFWSKEEIETAHQDLFTPNFLYDYGRLIDFFERKGY